MQEYFTLESLLAYPTAIVAITLVMAAVGYLGGARVTPALKWVALGVALFIAYLAAFVQGGEYTRWIVAFFNALVLFLAATGANTVLASYTERRAMSAPPAALPRRVDDGTPPGAPPAAPLVDDGSVRSLPRWY